MENKRQLSDILQGVLFMLLHAISLSVVLTISKKVSAFLSPEQMTFFYKLSVLLIILPLCLYSGILSVLKTEKIVIHFIRSFSSTMANLCFYYGLKAIPLIDASAVTYFEQVVVCLIGIFYFREKITLAKIILVVSGVIGAFFIMHPGFSSFNTHYVFILMAIAFWALNNTMVKILGRTEKTITQLFYSAFFGSMIALTSLCYATKSFDITANVIVNANSLFYVFIAALAYLLHVVAFFKAFKFADVSTVMPFDYTRLIFTVLMSYMLLGEVPQRNSMMGCSLIILGSLYLIYDEGKKTGVWARQRGGL